MGMQSLEDLVVRLIGDIGKYTATMTEAVKVMNRATDNITARAQKMAGKTAAAFGAVGASALSMAAKMQKAAAAATLSTMTPLERKLAPLRANLRLLGDEFRAGRVGVQQYAASHQQLTDAIDTVRLRHGQAQVAAINAMVAKQQAQAQTQAAALANTAAKMQTKLNAIVAGRNAVAQATASRAAVQAQKVARKAQVSSVKTAARQRLAFAKQVQAQALASAASVAAARAAAFRGIGQAATAMSTVAVRAIQGITRALGGLGQATQAAGRWMQRLGMGISLTFGLVAARAIKGSVEAFAEFDDTMNKVFGISEGLTDGMKKQMRDLALQISGESVFSANELAGVYYELATAGLNAETSIKAMPIVNAYAAASLLDVKDAAESLMAVLAAMGLQTGNTAQDLKELQRIADVVSKVAFISLSTPGGIAKTITTKLGAGALMVGKSLEETVSIAAAFAKKGMPPELAGEQGYMFLRDVQAANIRHSEVWKEFGLIGGKGIYDIAGKMRPVADIIEDLTDILSKSSDEQQKKTLWRLGFTDRSIAATQTLLGMSKEMRHFEEEAYKAGGTVKNIAENNLASFSSQMEILGNNVQNAGIAIGEVLVPYITSLDTWIRRVLRWFTELDEEGKKFAIAMGIAAVAVGPVLVVLGFLVSTAGGIVTAMAAMASATISAIGLIAGAVGTAISGIMAVAGAIGAVIGVPAAAVVALVAAIGLVTLALYGPGSFAEAWGMVQVAAMSAFTFMIGFAAHFQENMSSVMIWLERNWVMMLINMRAAFEVFLANLLINIASAAGNTAASVGGKLGAFWKAEWDVVLESLANPEGEANLHPFETLVKRYEKNVKRVEKNRKKAGDMFGKRGAFQGFTPFGVEPLVLNLDTKGTWVEKTQEGLKAAVSWAEELRKKMEEIFKHGLPSAWLSPLIDWPKKMVEFMGRMDSTPYGTAFGIAGERIKDMLFGSPKDSVMVQDSWYDLLIRPLVSSYRQNAPGIARILKAFGIGKQNESPFDPWIQGILDKLDAEDEKKTHVTAAPQQAQLAPALVLGSQAAADAILRAMFSKREGQDDLQKKALDQAQQANKHLGKIEVILDKEQPFRLYATPF